MLEQFKNGKFYFILDSIMDTWKPKYFNKQDLPDRTKKNYLSPVHFLTKRICNYDICMHVSTGAFKMLR